MKPDELLKMLKHLFESFQNKKNKKVFKFEILQNKIIINLIHIENE